MKHVHLHSYKAFFPMIREGDFIPPKWEFTAFDFSKLAWIIMKADEMFILSLYYNNTV